VGDVVLLKKEGVFVGEGIEEEDAGFDSLEAQAEGHGGDGAEGVAVGFDVGDEQDAMGR
jgi:hypothetical protein